jgi:sulfur transfer protein SufE
MLISQQTKAIITSSDLAKKYQILIETAIANNPSQKEQKQIQQNQNLIPSCMVKVWLDNSNKGLRAQTKDHDKKLLIYSESRLMFALLLLYIDYLKSLKVEELSSYNLLSFITKLDLQSFFSSIRTSGMLEMDNLIKEIIGS